MTRSRLYPVVLSAIFCLAPASSTFAAQAAQAPAGRQPVASRPAPALPPRALPPMVRTVTEASDARETRSQLQEILRQYSPSLGAVLKLDPTLLIDATYLAPYPTLSEFLAQHPEIARDPRFFFQEVSLPSEVRDPERTMDARERTLNLWENFFQGSLVFLGFTIVTITLAWLIKTLIDYRRWSRLAKVQADAHNKVLDRFGDNEQLLTYVQTPAGRRFLESAPIALDPAAPAVAAPLRRILWAVEAGFVLMAGGVGLQYVSGRVPADVSPMPLALGTLGVALGIGFILAALVSFFISKRLGLFPPPAAPQAREQV